MNDDSFTSAPQLKRGPLGRAPLSNRRIETLNYVENVLIRFYMELGTTGLVAAGALGFVALANSRAVTGEHMEKPHRIGQLYGYTVCLVAVVTFLTSANSLVKAFFALANPISYGQEPFRMGFEPSLSSFEAFRATYMFGGRAMVNVASAAGDSSLRADTLSTAELQSRYDALRSERVAQVRQAALSEVVTSGMLIVIAVVLFGLHWRWLRAREREAAPA